MEGKKKWIKIERKGKNRKGRKERKKVRKRDRGWCSTASVGDFTRVFMENTKESENGSGGGEINRDRKRG